MAYAEILTALADPTRRAIFEDLRQRAQPVSVLASRHPVSRPAVSQHLKVLESAGLVEVRAKGNARFYSVRAQGLDPLRAYLDDVWGDVLQAFKDEVLAQKGRDDARTGHQND